MHDIVTADFSNFGYTEIDSAIELLKAYSEGKKTEAFRQYFGYGVKICFNSHSGFVFLSDENYQSAMINEHGALDLFLSCPNCGNEGFGKDIYNEPQCDECQEFAKDYVDLEGV